MNIKRYLFLLAAVFLIPVFVPASGRGQDTRPDQSSVSVTDVKGRVVSLPSPASRLVGTHNPTLNIAVILGGGGKYIAGFGNKNMAGGLYAHVFPELKDIPQVGRGSDINIESCLKAGADLAILPERNADQAALLENAGIPSAVILPGTESFETIKSSLVLLGRLLGEEEKAEKIITFFDGKVNAAKEIAGNIKTKPKVLFLGGSSKLSAANGAMLQSVMLETVGAVNAAKNVEGRGGFIEVSIEEIIGWNPDVIYVPVFASYTTDDILNDKSWSSISAVQNGKVFAFPGALEPWDYPTPSAALGLVWLLNNLYPELYPGEKVLSDAGEYYGLVYGQVFSAEQLGL